MNQYYEAAYINTLEKIASEGGNNTAVGLGLTGLGLAGAGAGAYAYNRKKAATVAPEIVQEVAEAIKANKMGTAGKAGLAAAGLAGLAGLGYAGVKSMGAKGMAEAAKMDGISKIIKKVESDFMSKTHSNIKPH